MRTFEIAATLICPSNWTEEDVSNFVRRQLLTAEEEKQSLIVWQIADGAKPAEPEALMKGLHNYANKRSATYTDAANARYARTVENFVGRYILPPPPK